MRSCLLALIASAQVSAAEPAWLTSAQAQMRELRFEQASATVKAGVAMGGATAATLASGYLIWAQAEASMGRERFAVELFARALELAPQTLLPADAPPKVQRPFQRARETSRALRVDATSQWLSDGRVQTKVTVRDDAQSLVQSGRVWPAPFDAPVPVAALPNGEATWRCEQPPCPFTVELLDEAANVVRALGSRSAPLVIDAVAQVPVAVAEAPVRGLRRAWPLVAGAAAAAVATSLLGVFFARTQSQLLAVTNDRSAHLFSEAMALDATRRGLQAGTIAGGVLTVGLAVGAVLAW